MTPLYRIYRIGYYPDGVSVSASSHISPDKSELVRASRFMLEDDDKISSSITFDYFVTEEK